MSGDISELSIAKKYLDKQDFVNAVKYYQKYLDSCFFTYSEEYKQAEEAIKLLNQSKDIPADDLNNIGILYHNADNVKKDYEKARQWYSKAISKGSSIASRNLGLLYEYGDGVQKNLVKALGLYQKALNTGYQEAEKDLKRLFDSSDFTADELFDVGVSYYSAGGAYCRDLRYFEYNFNVMHHSRWNTPASFLIWLFSAPIGRDYKNALKWLEKAKEKGSAIACVFLGGFYENALGVEKNFVTAMRYYQQSSELVLKNNMLDVDTSKNKFNLLNHDKITADDLNNIGVMYESAEGITRDFEAAKKCFDMAIAKGSVIAYRNLGTLYENGNGVAKNLVTAAKYYQQAFEKGYQEAENDLKRLFDNPDITAEDLNATGFMYQTSDSKDPRYSEALKWLEKAKEKGSADAYRNLGKLYEEGRGVPKNFLTAARYYQQALEKGCVQSEDDLKRLIYDDSKIDADKLLALFEASNSSRSVILIKFYLNQIHISKNIAGLKFEGNKSWLHILPTIHYDSSLRELIHDVAKKVMAEQISPYERTNDSRTAFSFIKDDPYQLSTTYRPQTIKTDYIGVEKQINDLEKFLKKIKENPDGENHFSLLSGPPGVGKTDLTNRICKANGFDLKIYGVATENDMFRGQQELRVIKYFEEAKSAGKHICLFMDEMDTITLDTDQILNNNIQTIAEIQKQIDALVGTKVVLIGATNYLSLIKPAIRNRAKNNIIHFRLPGAEARRQLIEDRLRMFQLEDNLIIGRLVESTSGWSPRELVGYLSNIIDRTKINGFQKCFNKDFEEEFETIRTFLQDDYKKRFNIIMSPPRLTINSKTNEKLFDGLVGWDDTVKEKLILTHHFLKDPKYFIDRGVSKQKNLILYGPPGTGKGSFVRALFENSNAMFICLEGGVHEASHLDKIFEVAKSFEKAIIFFDELDSIVSYRPAETVIQAQMDGITKHDKILIVIGATNHLQSISPAMRDRFQGNILEIPLPNEEQRIELFKYYISKIDPKIKCDKALMSEESYLHFAQDSDGYSPRKISKLIGEAISKYLSEILQGNEGILFSPERIYREIIIDKPATSIAKRSATPLWPLSLASSFVDTSLTAAKTLGSEIYQHRIEPSLTYDQVTLTMQIEPLRGAPIYQYHIANKGQGIGSITLYGEPYACQDKMRTNVLETTGVLSYQKPVYQYTCQELPPNLYQTGYDSALQGIQLGFMRGFANSVGKSLRAQKLTSTNAQMISSVLFYGLYFTWNLCNIYQRQSAQNHSNIIYQIGIDTLFLAATNIVLSLFIHSLRSAGKKLQERDWNNSSYIIHKSAALAGYLGYAYQGIKATTYSPIPMITAIELGVRGLTSISGGYVAQSITEKLTDSLCNYCSFFNKSKLEKTELYTLTSTNKEQLTS